MALTVLITDYAWPSLDIEQTLLGSAGIALLAAERGDEQELIELAPQADAILTNWKPVTAAVLDATPNCQIVVRYGVGLDNIAVKHATALGIPVANVPDYCVEEVSDHAMALLLACARSIVGFARSTRDGAWDLAAGQPLPRLRGQTLGLVGYGHIARTLVPKAAGFGMTIIAYTPRLPADALAPFGKATNDFDLLLRQSDYISLHLPLSGETHHLIDRRALQTMKPTAYLINTARGAIIDETALYQALTEGWIAGAALDVLTTEPAAADHPLRTLDNVILTPHTAFYSDAAIKELQTKAAAQVKQALQGEIPANLVNSAVQTQPNFRLRRHNA
jgi:D-3-phosphoglycerate dehydrogenase